jgi:hypothetical protein
MDSEEDESATEKSISLKTGLPLVPGGAPGLNVDIRRVLVFGAPEDNEEKGEAAAASGRTIF